MLRRLLPVPLLAPLLALLLVAALNPRPRVGLRLLTWSSGALPLGAWIALAGAGGAALSAGATALALGQGQGAPPLRRQVRRRPDGAAAEAWEDGEELEREREPMQRRRWRESPPPDWAAVGGSRAPGEPAPTVAVPFRVLRRGQGSAPAAEAPTAERGREREPEPVAAGDEWGAAGSEDW